MKNIYAIAGRWMFLLARPLLRLYFKSKSNRRVRIIVTNSSYELLLVKGWFSQQFWELPGGGINYQEQPVDAAVRELYEETGVRVKANALLLLGEYQHTSKITPYTVVLYTVETDNKAAKTPSRHAWEILDAQWFSRSELPDKTHVFVAEALRLVAAIEKQP